MSDLVQVAKNINESQAEKLVKDLAVLTLPKDTVYPESKGRLPRAEIAYDMGSSDFFEVNKYGIGFLENEFSNDNWKALESDSNGRRRFYINTIHYGFTITYFDPDYFDPDYFDTQLLASQVLYNGGVVLEKGNISYVLPTASFTFILDYVSRMETVLAITSLPNESLSYEFLNAFVKELESVALGLERSVEGLNFFNADRQIDIAEENERMIYLLLSILNNSAKFLKIFASCLAISFIVAYFKNLSPKEKEKIRQISKNLDFKDKAMKIAAKKLGKTFARKLVEKLSKKIAIEISKGKTFKALTRLLKLKLGEAGTSAKGADLLYKLIKWQSVLQRASKSSHRLKSSNKYLYDILFTKNLDMAYWIVEPHINEYKKKFKDEIKNIFVAQKFY